MITHVILDLDGTLYKENKRRFLILKEFSETYNLDFNLVMKEYDIAVNEVLNSEKKFKSTMEFFYEAERLFFPRMGLKASKKNLEFIRDTADRILPSEINLIPRKGVVDFLKYVKSKKLKCIVFSGGNPLNIITSEKDVLKNTERRLKSKTKQVENMGLIEYVDEVIPTDKFGGYKPEKKVYERLLKHLNCKGENCIMIGNHDMDIAASRVGMKTILIENKGETITLKPDHRTKNFSEIKDVVMGYVD